MHGAEEIRHGLDRILGRVYRRRALQGEVRTCYIMNNHDGLDAARQDELCLAFIQVSARLKWYSSQGLSWQLQYVIRLYHACHELKGRRAGNIGDVWT